MATKADLLHATHCVEECARTAHISPSAAARALALIRFVRGRPSARRDITRLAVGLRASAFDTQIARFLDMLNGNERTLTDVVSDLSVDDLLFVGGWVRRLLSAPDAQEPSVAPPATPVPAGRPVVTAAQRPSPLPVRATGPSAVALAFAEAERRRKPSRTGR